MKLIKVFFLIVFILCCELTSAQQRFKIENGSFLIVGKRTQLICGEMHSSRILERPFEKNKSNGIKYHIYLRFGEFS